MKSLRAVATIAFMLLTTLSASAELKFDVSGDPGEPTIVIVTGEFSARQDLQAFVDVVLRNNAKVVAFNSPGGSVMKAMESRAHHPSQRPDNGSAEEESNVRRPARLPSWEGRVRMAEPGSIGVHKSSFSSTSDLSAKRCSIRGAASHC